MEAVRSRADGCRPVINEQAFRSAHFALSPDVDLLVNLVQPSHLVTFALNGFYRFSYPNDSAREPGPVELEPGPKTNEVAEGDEIRSEVPWQKIGIDQAVIGYRSKGSRRSCDDVTLCAEG